MSPALALRFALIAFNYSFVCLPVCVVIAAVAPESHLVSGGSDNRLIVWKAQNGKVTCLFHQPSPPGFVLHGPLKGAC